MTLIQWIIENIEWVITLIIVPLITWFGGKRYFQIQQLKAGDLENNASQSDIVSKNLELYQKMLDDIEQRYEETVKKRDLEIKQRDLEINELKADIEELKERITECEEILK